MSIVDIAKAIQPENNLKIVGIRPGEKLHEQMIGSSEYTYEYNDYKILPSQWMGRNRKVKEGIRVPKDFIYSSDKNSDWMSRKLYCLG